VAQVFLGAILAALIASVGNLVTKVAAQDRDIVVLKENYRNIEGSLERIERKIEAAELLKR